MTEKAAELKRRYDTFAQSGDEKTTACDYNLRELEIRYGLEYIRDGDVILDVGCGPAVALQQYAARRRTEAAGAQIETPNQPPVFRPAGDIGQRSSGGRRGRHRGPCRRDPGALVLRRVPRRQPGGAGRLPPYADTHAD